MGGARYKSDKEGGGHSFDCSCVQPRKSAHVMFTATWKPSKQIIGLKTKYCRTESPAALKSSPDGTQHSERHDVTVSIV